MIVLSGSVLGLLSVVMAALVDHYFAAQVNGVLLGSLLTAVRYHQLYAMLISVTGLICTIQTSHRIRLWLSRAAWIFTAGVILFSFSIYFSIIFNEPALRHITPVGGMIMMIGWIALIRTALLK